MKTLGIALFIFALSAVAPAQTPTASSNKTPDLQVIKVSWKIAYRLYGEGYQSSPAPKDYRSGQRAISNPGARIPEYVYSPISNPYVRNVSFPKSKQFKSYFYEAKVRHTGTKKIAAVKWEYLFIDSLNQKIVERHRFYTKLKISPGSEKKLGAFDNAPPTKTINAKTVENNPDQPFTEQVLITRIEYADGTVWELPSQ